MKKRKPLASDEDAIDEAALFRIGDDGLEKVTIADRNFWSDADLLTARWLMACEAVDQRDDMQPLLERLQKCIPAGAFPYVKDLLERLTQKGKQGRPRTPSYQRSPADVILLLECEDVKALVKAGCAVEEAVEQVAKRSIYRTNFQTLLNAYQRKRTSTRRLQQRAKPK